MFGEQVEKTASREREREGKIDEHKQGGDGDGQTEWLKTRF